MVIDVVEVVIRDRSGGRNRERANAEVGVLVVNRVVVAIGAVAEIGDLAPDMQEAFIGNGDFNDLDGVVGVVGAVAVVLPCVDRCTGTECCAGGACGTA